MLARLLTNEKLLLVRYYAAGISNMLFGYILFVIINALGVQVYAAQALSHVIGMIFNYFSYSKIAFTGREASKLNFIASYVANYFVSLFLLWLTLKILPNPIVAGLIVTVATSLINYFVLKKLVFRLVSTS